MPPAPARLGTGSSPFYTATSPKSTSGFIDGISGEVIVAGVIKANTGTSELHNFSIVSNALTFTNHTANSGTFADDTYLQTAGGVLTGGSGTSEAVNVSRISGNSTDFWGVVGFHYWQTEGIGAVASSVGAGGAPSFNVTTQFNNSALLVFMADWAATDYSTRTWKTVNGYAPTLGNGGEAAYFRDTNQYTLAVAAYADTGVAGVKTVGFDAPVTGDWSFAVVEVRGTGGAVVLSQPILLEDGTRLLLEDSTGAMTEAL